MATWPASELAHFKVVTRSEKDLQSGKIVRWQGPLLSELIDKALDGIAPERKAQVDLVILKDQSGVEALIPRSFVTKYPLVLAIKGDGQNLGFARAVVPWTSQPKALQEDLPVERYFVPHVVSVELSNYRERYGTLYLSRRTDPAAMRGEKIFVQSCTACHSGPQGTSIQEISTGSKSRALASADHPEVAGMPKIRDKDKRALFSYLDAFHLERSASQTATPVAGAK